MYTLIMDLDGTLINSVPDICASLNRALASEGLSPLPAERVGEMIRYGSLTMVGNIVRESGRDRDIDIAALRDLFLAEYSARPVENSVIYPGVIEVLEKFKADGVRLGLCTNKPEKTTYPVLQAFGLDAYFPAIVCGDTLPYRKPDGRHVHEVINLLDGDAATAVFIGDSEPDVAAARNAGLPVVLVTYGYALSPPHELGADVLIDYFGELPDALDTINQRHKR